MILVDTNIFLEILLEQQEKEKCKAFLAANNGNLCLSDFSLHSIGVILFNKNKHSLFTNFLSDVLPKVFLTKLSTATYNQLESVATKSGLDFDDAYQYSIGVQRGFEIATMDNDFKRVSGKITVRFI